MVSGQSARIRMCNVNDAAALAWLHHKYISDHMDTVLLEAYYRVCLTSKCSFCICAEMDGTIIGYIGIISERMTLVAIAICRELMAILRCISNRPVMLLELARQVCRWMHFATFSRSHAQLPLWEYRPVVVAKEYRGQRVAQLLLAAAEHVLQSRGVSHVHLWVKRDNVSAIRAYEHSGFKYAGSSALWTLPMLKDLRSGGPVTCRS